MRLSGGHKGKGSDKESNAGENKGSDEVDLRRDSGTDIGCTWSSVHPYIADVKEIFHCEYRQEVNTRMCYNDLATGAQRAIWSFPDTPATSLPLKLLYYVTPRSRPPFLLVEILFTVYDYMHVWFQVDSCHFKETRHRFYTSSSVHCLVMFTVEYYSVPEDFVKYNTFCGSEGVLSIMRN